MKPKTLILLMVAIGCGLVAAFLASQATGKAQVNKLPVVVTKAEVRQGTFITEKNVGDFFEVQERDQATVPPNTVTDINELKRKLLANTLDQGQMVKKQDVAGYEGLAKTLKEGQRAVTLRVTIDTAVAGFVVPGSHVDLVCNMPDAKNPQLIQSRIFLQNVLVLAVNTEDSKPAESKVMQQPGLVTLALYPADAERAIRVSKDGVPYMVLRRPDDDKVVKTYGAVSAFGRSNTDVETTAAEAKKVLVAKKAINDGTTIDNVADFFETKDMPADLAPDNAISNPKEIQGQKVKFIGAQTPLTRDYVMATGRINTDPAPIKKAPPRMIIWQGPNKQVVDFQPPPEGEAIPPGTTGGSKEGGSEGK
jgi:Flp pilus assembly protein CpaB